MKPFAEALSKGALNNLEHLNLTENKIGDEGMKPFAEALSKGALNNLKNLDLWRNTIGDEGMKAFSEALSMGAMDKITVSVCFLSLMHGLLIPSPCFHRCCHLLTTKLAMRE